MKPLTREWVAKAEGDYVPAFAVETRYPGKSVDRAAAREAVALCSSMRAVIRKAFRAAR